MTPDFERRQSHPDHHGPAANYLGVSRQHLVGLIDEGEIAHRMVGTHRRVSFKDLLAYEKSRDKARREALDRLTDQVIAGGKYFPDTPQP